MATFHSPNIVRNGLVLCLDAGNSQSYPGSGATWTDLSGKGNHCSFASTPTYNSSGYLTFDGSNHYGTITNNSTLDFSSAQTLMIVMNHTYTSGRRNPWNQAYAGYGTWTHEQGDSISHYFGDGGGDNSPYVGLSSATTPRSAWNYMCTTRDTSESRWYINGSLSGAWNHSYGVLTTTSANILIGNGYAGLWAGNMAIVLAYTRALTAAEVLQNFDATKRRFGL
jgi:hypothetical protein